MKKLVIIMSILTMVIGFSACTMAPSREKLFFVGADLETIHIREDGYYVIPEVTQEGYQFSGWYFDADFTRPYANDGGLLTTTTLYAKWDVEPFTLTYNFAEGERVQMVHDFGSPLDAPLPEDKPHRVFTGWLDVDSGEWFTDGTMPARHVNLEAMYTWLDYRFTVAGESTPIAYLSHQDSFDALPEPQKVGHRFMGWYVDEAYEIPLDLSQFPEEDTLLFARFEPEAFQLVFQTEGGNSVQSEHVFYQSPMTLPEPAQRPGYTFGGWYTDPDFNEYVFPGTVMPANNVVLYARWVEQSSSEMSQAIQSVITTMIAEVSLAFVGIRNDRGDNGGGIGSGVVYKQEGDTYFVVTNHHVIEDFETLTVTYQRYGILFDIDFADITFIGSDPTTDLAVLSFTSSVPFNTVEIADSYTFMLGQFVFAMGNPLGFDNFSTVTMGVISGLTRFKQLNDLNTAFIQHDAAINRGNSGGPLFTLDGELAGINTLKTMSDSQGDATEGLGFAVPANTVLRVVRDLEDFGVVRRPFLGIMANPVYGTCGQIFGVCVTGTTAGSAAEAAGLQENDIIIGYKTQEQISFVPVFNFDQLREVILNSRVGDRIQIQFIRDGETIDSPEVLLGLHPDD